jgi:hypothetical protein
LTVSYSGKAFKGGCYNDTRLTVERHSFDVVWCAGVVSCSCGGVWYSGTVHARRVAETSGAFLCRDARAARGSRPRPSPLVYFERRIANGHGFARVYRDLISNIYNYGITGRRLTTKNRQQNVFRSDQHPHTIDHTLPVLGRIPYATQTVQQLSNTSTPIGHTVAHVGSQMPWAIPVLSL